MCVRSVKIKHPPRLLGQRRRRSAKEMSAIATRTTVFKQPSRPTLQHEVLCEPSLSPILPDGDHSTGPSTSKWTVPPGRCSLHWHTSHLTVPSGRWRTPPRSAVYSANTSAHSLAIVATHGCTPSRVRDRRWCSNEGSHKGEERSPRYTYHRGWHGQPPTCEHLRA